MRNYSVIVVNPLEKCDRDDKPAGTLYQYDYGQRLVFGGVELPEAYEVHFSNQRMGNSVTMIGDVTGVDIPDAMLLTGQDVHVWLYLHQGEADGETVYYARIAVKTRAKPTHEEPTPVQQDEITQAIAALNAAGESTEADAAAAEASASAAAEAQAAAEAAQDGAESAMRAAEACQTGAETAEEAAEDAQAAAERARDEITGMTADATTLDPGESATASYEDGVLTIGVPRGADGEPGADGYSPAASVSKSGTTTTITITDKSGTTTATVSDGEDGQDGHTPEKGVDYWTAADKTEIISAVEAEVEPEISDVKSALDSKAPVILRDASGDIVSFADGADGIPLSSCVVSIDPVQDLHGQSNPYPGGGNVNLFSFADSNWSNSNNGVTIAYDAGTEKFTFSGSNTKSDAQWLIANVTPAHLPDFTAGETYVFSHNLTNKAYAQLTYRKSGGGTVASLVFLAGGSTGNVTFTIPDDFGTFANFQIGIYSTTTSISETATFEVSAGSTAPTSWTPYSNLCPITGHTGAVVSRTGRNLWDSAVFLTASGWTKSGDEYTGSSANLYSASWTGIGYRKFKPNTQYTFSFWYKGDEEKNTAIDLYYTDGTYTRQNANVTTYTKYTLVSTAWKTVNYIRFGYGSATTIHFKEVMLEEGSSASTYKPYQGQTYPISWQTAAGTVYGGDVDPVKGELVVDRATMTLDSSIPSGTSGIRNITELDNCVRFEYFPYRNIGVGSKAAVLSDKFINVNTGIPYTIFTGTAEPRLYLCLPSTYTTDELIRSWFTDNPTQVVYKLATPQTYQLDPVQITALRESSIWADTGAIAVTYPADTQTYVDSAITAATDPDGNVVQVTGSTPSITGESGKRYVCGTVDSLSITPPQTGIIDVVFSSGTTPTVLTVPSGVKFPAWFDPTSLDASTTYEINVQDGIYGAVMAWT